MHSGRPDPFVLPHKHGLKQILAKFAASAIPSQGAKQKVTSRRQNSAKKLAKKRSGSKAVVVQRFCHSSQSLEGRSQSKTSAADEAGGWRSGLLPNPPNPGSQILGIYLVVLRLRRTARMATRPAPPKAVVDGSGITALVAAKVMFTVPLEAVLPAM